jgi:hypothetical protein
MRGRWIELCRGGVFAAVVVAVLLATWSATASARPGGYRWSASHLAVTLASRHRADSGEQLRARTAVVDGSPIAIAQAPWQVEVLAKFESGATNACGGTIIDEFHVVTAGYCAYDLESGQRLAPTALVVVGGTAHMSAEEIKENPEVQARFVSVVRVHPMFKFSEGPGTPDDVAVLTLETPLSLDASVQAVQLAAATPGVGAGVRLTGFGQQAPNREADSFLYSLNMTTQYSRRCGGDEDAVFICASAPGGSGCLGDSGSGLTSEETSELVGVLDTVAVVSGEECAPGADNAFINLTAPEIRDFIEGSENPPQAPRGGSAIEERGVPRVGNALTCEPGSWTGSPSYAFIFIDSANGQTLQDTSSPTYQLTEADIGRTIYCEVQAVNAGGTGVVRTSALRAIEAALSKSSSTAAQNTAVAGNSQPPVLTLSVISLAKTDITVEQSGAMTIKLNCTGETLCSGKLTLLAKSSAKKIHGKRASRRVTIGGASFMIDGGASASVTLHLNGTGRALLSSKHGHLTATLEVSRPETGQNETKTVYLQSAPRTRKKNRK